MRQALITTHRLLSRNARDAIPKKRRPAWQTPKQTGGKAERASQDTDSFRRATQIVQENLKEGFTHSNSSKADGQRGQRVYNRHDGKGFSQRWRSRHDFALKCAPGAVKGTEVEKMRRDSKTESKCRPSSANEIATKCVANLSDFVRQMQC